MTQITGVLCQMITSKSSGAGADGDVFLGLCGREFVLDSKYDDFESGSWKEYILGAGPPADPNSPPPPIPNIPVLNPELNDPRSSGFPLDSVNLNRSPVYIRFEPKGSDDNWNPIPQ
jgi:hypothetical protein